MSAKMGDAVNSKKLFMKLCVSCHTIKKSGKHKMGSNLHDIMGKTCESKCSKFPNYQYFDRKNNLIKSKFRRNVPF